MWALGYPMMAYAARTTPVRPAQIFHAALPAACLSLLTGAALLGLKVSLFRTLPPWLALGLAATTTAVIWILFNLRRTNDRVPLDMILNALRAKSAPEANRTFSPPSKNPLST